MTPPRTCSKPSCPECKPEGVSDPPSYEPADGGASLKRDQLAKRLIELEEQISAFEASLKDADREIVMVRTELDHIYRRFGVIR